MADPASQPSATTSDVEGTHSKEFEQAGEDDDDGLFEDTPGYGDEPAG